VILACANDLVCPCALICLMFLWKLKYAGIILLVDCLIPLPVLITRFDFSYNADDYDRSINEAIKITKYVDLFYYLINLFS
jgi:hypothetical protein